MSPKIQKRIDQLYASMGPLQELYGIKSKTIAERYQESLQRKAGALQTLSLVPKPRFKLPKL